MIGNIYVRSFGVALILFVFYGTSVAADKLKDVSCEQFLSMDETNQNAIVFWIDGIETASSASGNSVTAADIAVGYDLFGNPVAEVINACTAEKKASLWEKVKEHFHKDR
jgi:hypothetical protein